jgi:flavodoxin I
MYERMKKTALLFVSKGKQTSLVAAKIAQAYGKKDLDIVAVEELTDADFKRHDRFLVGASTWFDGELPTYWDELLPELRTLDLKGKQIALFGLGNQRNHPENFCDGIGLLATLFEERGARLVGFTSTEGYAFERSLAQRGAQWCGLAIDQDTQPELTDQRINDWCAQVKKEWT